MAVSSHRGGGFRQPGAKTAQSPRQSHLDRVGGGAGQLGDLAGAHVRAVAKRDQLAVALTQAVDGLLQHDPIHDLVVGLIERRFPVIVGRQGYPDATVGQDATSDTEQPRNRLTFRSVVAPPIADGAREHLPSDVVGLGPVADAIGDICVHAANQGSRVGERI